MNKQEILDRVCYTELVYGRINKKLSVNYSKEQIEDFILRVLEETSENFFTRKGKNYYIFNEANNIRITINSGTFRVITVDRIK